MGLYGKKKDVKESGCCCGGTAMRIPWRRQKRQKQIRGNVMVLGSGCAKCNELEAIVKSALEELGMDTDINHVTDFTQIAAYGVMTTPRLW